MKKNFLTFKLTILVGLSFGAFSSFSKAETPSVECTKESICASHAQLMANATAPATQSQLTDAVRVLKYCANADHPFAQFGIAYAYESGSGVPKDLKQALDYYLKAAFNGSTAAMEILVDYYNGAMGADLKEDKAECYAWAILAHKLGDSESAEFSPLCRGSKSEKSAGEKRSDELMRQVKITVDAKYVTDCR